MSSLGLTIFHLNIFFHCLENVGNLIIDFLIIGNHNVSFGPAYVLTGLPC